MGYFPVRYNSRVVIYERKMFIRFSTGCPQQIFSIPIVNDPLGRFTCAAVDACGCGRQLHFQRDTNFSKFLHCNILLQLHASNAACVNKPLWQTEFAAVISPIIPFWHWWLWNKSAYYFKNIFAFLSVRLHDSIQEESFHYLVFDLWVPSFQPTYPSVFIVWSCPIRRN